MFTTWEDVCRGMWSWDFRVVKSIPHILAAQSLHSIYLLSLLRSFRKHDDI